MRLYLCLVTNLKESGLQCSLMRRAVGVERPVSRVLARAGKQ